jgi:hypothetical protein
MRHRAWRHSKLLPFCSLFPAAAHAIESAAAYRRICFLVGASLQSNVYWLGLPAAQCVPRGGCVLVQAARLYFCDLPGYSSVPRSTCCIACHQPLCQGSASP